jgi:DNA-binding XRE family transcriptional regulator
MKKMVNKLEYFRNQAGLSRAELADLIAIDRTLVWRYEKGICQPRDEIKIKIAKVLGKTVGEFFFNLDVAYDATEQSTGTTG